MISEGIQTVGGNALFMIVQRNITTKQHVATILAAAASEHCAALTHVCCRAGLVFDPYKAYGGAIAGAEELSYVDIIINPLLAALNEALTRDTKVPDLQDITLRRLSRSTKDCLDLQRSLQPCLNAAGSHCRHV